MEASGEARLIYGLAARLNKFPSELLARPIEELRGMIAFLDWEAQQKKER